MESSRGQLLVVLITLAIIPIVQAQDQNQFLSLDCGLPSNESPYEASDGLVFYSDQTFVRSGETARVRENLEKYSKQYETLRYFPVGVRNCYSLPVKKGGRYLIRATFVYGNYDGLHTSPVFDLYIGPNPWATIDLRQVNGTKKEILHIPTSNSLQICLVKTNNNTTPLISTLELRPTKDGSYNTTSNSLKLFYREYLSKSGSLIRYKQDLYDRIWVRYFQKEWTEVSTALDVTNLNDYVQPQAVLKNAATPTDTSAPLTIEWDSSNPDIQYYLFLHFTEMQDLLANETREFNILMNGQHFFGPVSPIKRGTNTVSSSSPITCGGGDCNLQLTRTNNSTLPPLLNAYEVYTVIQFSQSETDESDVFAMENITAAYGLRKINWQGDPCVPQKLRWDGLSCSNTNMSIPPRITTLNLSSSGLNGIIAVSIQNLTQLEKLDLSNNKLTGEVPDFLGNMKSLSFINLSGNNLNGLIPQALRREGLELLVAGNPGICFSGSCTKPHKKNVLVPIVSSVSSAVIVIVIAVLVLRKKKSTAVEGLQLPPRMRMENVAFANSPEPLFDQKSKRFTHSEVIKMTNNFQRVLGKGGFGFVYYGNVNGSEVAVKVLSELSSQGYKQFKAEVDLLLRVHHKNLVSLVGYCYEGDNFALIYEFLPNGNLKEHLAGKRDRSVISWGIRLQIALEAAQGLEYLHIGCIPAMVHRDVKTTNILLDEHFKAKLADFGLSKSFKVGDESHVSTVIAGTHGYLDPQYYNSGHLSEKSDVYSFGIMLLEMITNYPVISEDPNIIQWVGYNLDRGDINGIMDPNLNGVYDSNSAWRALELAMSCADPSSANRPTMSHVTVEIKECLVCENSRISRGLESQEMSINLDTELVPGTR